MSTTTKQNRIEFKDNVLQYNTFSFYLFESFGGLKIEHLNEYSAIVLEANDPDFTKLILKRFRSHNNPEFYLKQIFLINYKTINDPVTESLHDGVIASYDQIPEKVNDIQQILTN